MQGAGEEPQQLQAPWVGPLKVVEDDDDRPLSGGGDDLVDHPLEHAKAGIP